MDTTFYYTPIKDIASYIGKDHLFHLYYSNLLVFAKIKEVNKQLQSKFLS